ncbi:hypothetical protein AYL20_00810 [Acinetobacter venetianus]|uniref:hypothetical protein n=1 Tax=Acinetobacter venetianus TaxID=52133 RepID=UPI000775BE06|nr:hypothetical protein [Acinetobacter venetianus]KXO82567.1 hypothetical protein AYL20_00810 [Acinetobacter venetianus]
MTNFEIILNSLDLLGYGRESSQVRVLKFFDEYQQQVKYIHAFLNVFSLLLHNVTDKDEIIRLFNEFNHTNWMEIDQHSFSESEYYLFLRLKVFLLQLHGRNDTNEVLEWLSIFQEKFLSYFSE